MNKTNIATPLPVNKPAIKDGNVIILDANNLVNITLDAQLGIKPIILAIKGPKILSFKNTFYAN